MININTFNKLPTWLILASLLSLTYLTIAQIGFGYNGFPLDDAWIHQTYARNLGLHGQFAFLLGQSSTGSTAPLWTILLSIGYFLQIPFKLWAYLLGSLCLGLSGFSMTRLAQQLMPKKQWFGIVVGLVLISEWHLIWAAVSGMETMLFIWLSILLIQQYFNRQSNLTPLNAFQIGLISGLLALVRPEGIGLLGLIGLHTAFSIITTAINTPLKKTILKITLTWLLMGLGLLIFMLPYLGFNYATSGHIFPNTFYAKQQEYASVIKDFNFITRWLNLTTITLIGGQILLIPGLINGVINIIKHKKHNLALIALWWFSYLTLYSFLLPVTYQHGRYQIPTIPWLLLLGLWGSYSLFQKKRRLFSIKVITKTWLISLILVIFIFIGLGGQAYGNDVTFIETEMVKTAQWLNKNTPTNAVIAAHDIGAIGYFTQRHIIDLAGLITPEVIPFIRDETKLLAFAKKEQATYLVTFPSWYPYITALLHQIYTTNSQWAINANHDNMTVYQLN